MSRSLWKWVKRGVLLAMVGGMAVGGAFVYEFLRGPRMKVQINLRPYQARLPLPPAGAVPFSPLPPAAAPTSAPATPENIARGEVYYGYYCLACHGEKGRGDGPVGESYMPVPADLSAARFRDLPDARLLQGMLLGPGHEPVLARVVPPRHQPCLLLYLRQLQTRGHS